MPLVAIGNGLYARTRPQVATRRVRECTAQPKRDAHGKFAAKVDHISPESTLLPEVFGKSEQVKRAADAARLRKATSLLILLLRGKLTADLAALMTDAEWCQVAQAARVHVPSQETREAVLGMMRTIETPLAGAIQ